MRPVDEQVDIFRSAPYFGGPCARKFGYDLSCVEGADEWVVIRAGTE